MTPPYTPGAGVAGEIGQAAVEITARGGRFSAAARIRPVIGPRYPLEHAADAHRAVEARDVIGKTLLEI